MRVPSSTNSPVFALRELSSRENLFIAAVAAVVTGVVCYFAWLSEDSFITLRYVSNTLGGYGPVFNVGERVQGYTHPLWFVLLLMGSVIYPNPIVVSYAYSFLFTLMTVVIAGRMVLRCSANFISGAALVGVTALVWSLSDPWVSFQTGGLENSLAHLLIVGIVYETWVRGASRAGRLMLFLGLLCLTRPDFLVWIAPLALVLLWRVRSAKQFGRMILAGLPVVAWLLFAWIYYHDIFPNTFYAKVGIFPSLRDAAAVGLAYLRDWFHYDALAAGATFVFLGFAVSRARSLERIALLAGIALYLIWVVQVGGDFMRGRFFVPILTAAMFTGSLAIAEQLRTPNLKLDVALAGAGCVLAILFIAWVTIAEPPAELASLGIVNERKFYPGYSLWYVLQHGQFENPLSDLNSMAQTLRDYVRTCGPVTIDMYSPGTIGYLAGPEVSVIDLLGLTDAYIAHLPRETLTKQIPRPGHPQKKIPVAYLLSRKDIMILPHWEESLKNGDCVFESLFKEMTPDNSTIPP